MRGNWDDRPMSQQPQVQFGRALRRSGMSHLCDSTVPGLAAQRDSVLASKCKYPLSVTPLKF